MPRIVEQTSQINLMDVIKGIGRWKMLLLSMPLLGLVIGEGVLMVNKPVYQAEAQVIVQSLATPFDKSSSVTDNNGGSDAGVSDRLVLSQVSVMKSRDLYSRVVDQLSLDNNAEYNTKLAGNGAVGSLLVMLGFKDDPNAFQPKDLAIKNLGAKVTVYPVPDSAVIGIKSNSTNPDTAASIANALAETYVLSTHEVGQSATDRARSWLSGQIDDLRAKVQASESEVEKYRADNGLLAGATSTVSKQQLSELNTQISLADAAKAEAQAKADEINRLLKNGGRIDASADVLSNTLIQALREQQVSAQRNVEQLSATYLPNHPKMIAAMKELDSVNMQVRGEALRVATSMQSQAKIADQRAQALRDQLTKLKTDQATANFSDVKLQELMREAQANRTLLQNMLARYADANARQDASLQPGYARVIQKATAPSVPYFPKAGPILLLSALGGLIMGLGLAFFLEVLAAGSRRNEVTQVVRRDEDEVVAARPRGHAHPIARNEADAFEVPPFELPSKRKQPAFGGNESSDVLGSIPGAITLGAAFTMLEDLKTGKGGALDAGAKKIVEVLERVKKDKGHSICAIASIGSQVPNAAVATLATARELASRNEKVIALDFSANANNLETLLDVPQGMGLIELIAGKADFTKIVTRCPLGFHVIRLGQPRSPELMQALTDKLPAILGALQKIYGHIILHIGEAGPKTVAHVAASDIAVLLAPQARMADAKAAAEGLEENSEATALVMRLEPEASSRRPEAA